MWQHRILFLKFFPQFLNWPWHLNKKCSKALEVFKLALLCKHLNCVFTVLNYFSFPCLVKRFARIPSAHLRHQKTLKPKGIDFVTEGEVDGGSESGSRTWAKNQAPDLEKLQLQLTFSLSWYLRFPWWSCRSQDNSAAASQGCNLLQKDLVPNPHTAPACFWDLLSHRVQANPRCS